MSDYINNEIPVADGVTFGVPPNTTTLYPWMSVKAGSTSYFGEVRMRGDIFDKNNVLITGGGGGGATELSQLTDVDLTPPLTNNQGLVFNQGTLKWENQTQSGQVGANTVKFSTGIPTVAGEWHTDGTGITAQFYLIPTDLINPAIMLKGTRISITNANNVYNAETTTDGTNNAGVWQWTVAQKQPVVLPANGEEGDFYVVLPSTISLNDLSDVVVNSQLDAQNLTYQVDTGKYQNKYTQEYGFPYIFKGIDISASPNSWVADSLIYSSITSIIVSYFDGNGEDVSSNMGWMFESGARFSIIRQTDRSEEAIFEITVGNNNIGSQQFELTVVNTTSSAPNATVDKGYGINPLSATSLNTLWDVNISNTLDDYKHLKWDVATSRWVDSYISVPDNTVDGGENSVWIDTAEQKLKFKPNTASETIVSYGTTGFTYADIATLSPAHRFVPEDIQQSANIITGWLDSGTHGLNNNRFLPGSNGIGQTPYVASLIGGKPGAQTSNLDESTYFSFDFGGEHAPPTYGGFTIFLVVQDLATASGTYFDLVRFETDDYTVPTAISLLYNDGAGMQTFTSTSSVTYTNPVPPPPNISDTVNTPTVLVYRFNALDDAYKVWLNRASDSVVVDTTLNTDPISRILRIGNTKFNGGLTGFGEPTSLKISEMVMFDTAISDAFVADVSQGLLVHYSGRPAGTIAGEANLNLEQLADVTYSVPPSSGETIIYDGVNWLNSKYNYNDLLNLPIIPVVPDEKSAGHITKYVGTTTPSGRGEWSFNAGVLQIWKEVAPLVTISQLFDKFGYYTFYDSLTVDANYGVYQLSKNSVITDVSDYISISLVDERVTPTYPVNTETILIAQPANIENFSSLLDVTLTSAVTGDKLVLIGTQWVNRTPTSGQIKINSFNTDITPNRKPTFTALTTEQEVVYRFPGETFTTLNASAFPTTTVPLTQNAGVYSDILFYEHGVAQVNDRFKQQNVQGVIIEYRVELSYTGKSAANSGRIQLRLYNPDSGFSLENNLALAQGLTADTGYLEFITISDSANVGAGLGYKMGISSTTSLDAVIDSITCISREYSYRS